MATSTQGLAPGLAANGEARKTGVGTGRLSRWLAPSLLDLWILSIPAWVFLSGTGGLSALLMDGDTGWHIRTGQWILSHMQIPQVDLFSFTKPGAPWFAWEWLSDVLYGLLVNAMGLKGVVWLGVILYTLYGVLVFRHMVWRGANLFIALPLALLAVGIGTLHLLARPHLFTLVLLAGSLWLIDYDLRKPTRWLWGLVPVTVLWTNLHGGWVSLVTVLGLVAFGAAIEAKLGVRNWTTVRRYAIVAAACAASTVINPYGLRLHAHIVSYLGAGWIKSVVTEFQAPRFRSENETQYEIVLLCGLIVAGLLLRRRRFIDALLIIFWAHASLISVRHALLLAIVVLPRLAAELSTLWEYWTAGARKTSLAGVFGGLAADCQPAIRRVTFWSVLPFLLLPLPALPLCWPANFPKQIFPVEVVDHHRDLILHARVLTSDQWADYLIYHNYPNQKVFFDGRSDFYGEKLGKEFLAMVQGNWECAALLEKHRIEVVMLPPDIGLSSVLKVDPRWRLVEDAGRVLLFVRKDSRAVGGFQP
jgi:hypothetical protein